MSTKTLAIRLDEELHAQLSIIAQLNDSSITEEIRTAIEAHIETTKASKELSGKADEVLDEIEREATTRREAITALFGETKAKPAKATSRTRKSTSESSNES